jgi:hypothetical protein
MRYRLKDGAGMDTYPPLENLCLKGNNMEIFESGFDKFWAAWPKNPRKGAKSECKKKWLKLKCEADIDQIIKHLEWMKTTDQWKQGNGAYIPAPLVYINQMRWDGADVPEIEITVSVAFKDPALRKIEEDSKRAAKPNADVQAKIAELLKGRA